MANSHVNHQRNLRQKEVLLSHGKRLSEKPAVVENMLDRLCNRQGSVTTEDPEAGPAAPRQQNLPSDDYFAVGKLLESVDSGAIAPLKGSWLAALRERGGRLVRRQDLPPEAFWTAAELRRHVDALGTEFGALFVALSYRWLTPEHPDPEGFHLAIVVDVLQRYLGTAGSRTGPERSPLVGAFEGKGLGAPDCAIFWDFASLYQKPRAANEDELFLQGLKASNVWYGHAASVCWMQSELPAGFAGVAYETSGWCFVEAAISAGVKPAKQRLDLGKRTDEALLRRLHARADGRLDEAPARRLIRHAREAGRQLALHPAHRGRVAVPDVGRLEPRQEERILVRRARLLVEARKVPENRAVGRAQALALEGGDERRESRVRSSFPQNASLV